MRKQILIAASLAALSTSAWATKARLQALGQDTDAGSLYYSDTRSVFKNPAYINEYNNFVITEVTRGNGNVAEGGFYKSAGSLNYGFNFSNSGLNNGGNELQAFVGGDAGIQWGVSAQIGKSEMESAPGVTSQDDSSFGLSAGAIMGNMEAYVRLSLKNETSDPSLNETTEGDLNPVIGVAYTMNNNTFFGEFEKNGSETTIAGATTETSGTEFRVGWGRVHKVSDSARIYTDVMFQAVESEPAANQEQEDKSVPVTVAMEADANSWLTLRGSVSHNIYETSETEAAGTETESSGIAGSTSVGVGATLNFGKLKVDGSIATQSSDTTARVGVHYWF